MNSDSSSKTYRFQANLKILLDRRRISPSRLARETRIPKGTIHTWLTESRSPTVDRIKPIASYFGMTVDSLCYDDLYNVDLPIQIPSTNHWNEQFLGVFEVVLRKPKNSL